MCKSSCGKYIIRKKFNTKIDTINEGVYIRIGLWANNECEIGNDSALMAKGKIYFSVCVYVHRTHKSVVIKRNEWIFATHERLCNWAVRRNAREHQQYNAENLELRVPTFSLPPISLARRSPRVSQVSKKYRGNRSRPFVRIYSWRHYVRVLAKAKFVNSSLPMTTLISDSKKCS